MFNKICYAGGAVLILGFGTGLVNTKTFQPTKPSQALGKDSLGRSNFSAAGPTDQNNRTNTNNTSPPEALPEGNGNISGTAYSMIGTSTADIQGTQGGNLGCAAAVSMMFQQATGQNILPGQGIVLSTEQLYSGLQNNSNFVEIPMNQVQAGDILVTAASGTQAGHTGIVGNNKEVISNSSNGFQGSSRGTIQQNYNTQSWQTSVVSRNPRNSGAFRYVGPINRS